MNSEIQISLLCIIASGSTVSSVMGVNKPPRKKELDP